MKLFIFPKNTNNVAQTSFEIENLIFNEFSLGFRRDEINYLQIYPIADGSITIRGEDFDNLKNYMFMPQVCMVLYHTENLYGLVSFSDISHELKFATMTIVLDNNYDTEKLREPVNLFDIGADDFYADADAFLFYDIPGFPFDSAGYEETTINHTDIEINALAPVWINSTERGELGEPLPPIPEHLNFLWKAKSVDYTGFNANVFESATATYFRAFKWMPDFEKEIGDWRPLGGIRQEHNGITYRKYIKEVSEGWSAKTGRTAYEMQGTPSGALGGDPFFVEFRAQDIDYKKSKKWFELKNFLLKLIQQYYDFVTSVEMDFFVVYTYGIQSLDNVFGDEKDAKVNLLQINDSLRDKFSLYFYIDGLTAKYKFFDFNTVEILKVENYRGQSWIKNNRFSFEELPETVEYTELTERTNFGDLRGRFARSAGIETKQTNFTTDLEIQEKGQDFMFVQLAEQSGLLNKEGYTIFPVPVDPANPTFPAFEYTPDGKFLKLVLRPIAAPGYEIKTTINTKEADTITFNATFTRTLTANQFLNIKLHTYDTSFDAVDGATISEVINTAAVDSVELIITVGNLSAAFATVIFSDLRVTGNRFAIRTATEFLTGNSSFNAGISQANVVSFQNLILPSKYGTLNGKDIQGVPDFFLQCEIDIPITDTIFDTNYNDFVSINGNKFFIFERTKRILSPDREGMDRLVLKANQNYV